MFLHTQILSLLCHGQSTTWLKHSFRTVWCCRHAIQGLECLVKRRTRTMPSGTTDRIQEHCSQNRRPWLKITLQKDWKWMLGLIYLYGTRGLYVGCEPVMAPWAAFRSQLFNGGMGTHAGCKSGFSPLLWECSWLILGDKLLYFITLISNRQH